MVSAGPACAEVRHRFAQNLGGSPWSGRLMPLERDHSVPSAALNRASIVWRDQLRVFSNLCRRSRVSIRSEHNSATSGSAIPMSTSTMRVVALRQHGGIEQLQLDRWPKPSVAD